MNRWLLCLFALATLGACSAPDLDSDPAVELGTGEVAYEALTPGQGVGIVSGIQGGQHIWGSARVVGVDWRELQLVFEIFDEDNLPATEPTTIITSLQECPRGEAGCDAGMGELVGVPVIVDDPGRIFGDDITMKLTVSDEAGREARTELMVRATAGTE